MKNSNTNDIEISQSFLPLTSYTSDTEKENSFKVKLAFFIIGLINNSGYVIILSASNELAKKFGKEDSVALFSGALILFGILLKGINSKYLVKIRHKIRIIIVIIFWVLGVITVCLSEKTNSFYLSITGVVIIGIGTSLGDITNVGFIKGFQPDTVMGYASGTGFAGIFGSVYYIVLVSLNFSLEVILLSLFVFFVIFFITFLWIIKMKTENDYGRISNLDMRIMIEQKEAEINDKISMGNILSLLRKTAYYSINILLVYFFEYSVIGYLASMAVVNMDTSNYFGKYAFEIIQVLYQVGVFLSRSSLKIVKIKRIHFITFFLFIAFSVFIYFSMAGLTEPFYLFITCLIVGLFGGCGYVNTYFLAYEDKTIPKCEKEIGLTIISVSCDMGVLINSIIGLIVLRHK